MSTDPWESRAAYRSWVDVFDQTFDATSRTSSRVHQLASDICGSCPVRESCLTDAMSNKSRFDRFGMRGGLMPVERTRLARQSA
jgi:hypothetical protein